MKHTQQSFVVEVRRRRNRPTSATVRAIEEDPFSAAVREHSQDFGSDEKPKVGQVASTVVEAHLAPPVGRILPSLIEDRVPHRACQNPDLSQPVIPSGTPTKAGMALDVSSNRECDERSLERPEFAHVGAAGQLRVPVPLPLQSNEARLGVASSRVKRTNKPDKGAPAAQSANSETRAGRKKASAPPPVVVLTDERRSVPATLDADSDGDVGVSSKRRRLILGRYVRGTEPKLGERWKFRLHKERR